MTFHARDLANSSLAPRSSILHYPQRGHDNLPCWIAMPAHRNPSQPPLVAIHGLHRCASAQVEMLATEAARAGRIVIAPLFAKERWPRYQQVVRRDRADLALMRVLEDLKIAGIWDGGAIDLAGYSAGAQFAHRFAMIYPHLVSRLHLTAAGWYTFPDETAFPYGIGTGNAQTSDWSHRLKSGLDAFLALPIHVYVGALDNIVDANTRSGRHIDAQQGRSRLDRAHTWVAAVSQAAKDRSVSSDITLDVMAGCGHDFTTCIRIGGLDRKICRPAT